MSHRKYPTACKAALTMLVTAATLLVATGAQATLVGVNVFGELGALGKDQISVRQQFKSPKIVDDPDDPNGSSEFFGTMEFGTERAFLDVQVDISHESFVIRTESAAGPWGDPSDAPPDGFSVSLTQLAWLGSPGVITGVALRGLPDSITWQETFENLITYQPDSILIQLLLSAGQQATGIDVFEFDITVEHVAAVPEPVSAALLVVGLAGMAFRRRAAL